MSQRGEILNIKQVQEQLGISERTVFRLISNGELRGFQVARKWRFYQSDIDNYIDNQRKKAEERLRDEEKPQDEAA